MTHKDLKAILVYIVTSRTAWATERQLVSKQTNKKQMHIYVIPIVRSYRVTFSLFLAQKIKGKEEREP